jgi:hypothetical protein
MTISNTITNCIFYEIDVFIIKIDFRLCFFPICLFIGYGGILTVKKSQICQYIDDPWFYSINKYTIVL